MIRTALAEFGDSMMSPPPTYMATWVIVRDRESVAKKPRTPGSSAFYATGRPASACCDATRGSKIPNAP